MIICTNCGRENEDHYKYCLGCGTVLPSPAETSAEPEAKVIPCPHCGSQVPSDNRFCGSCGGAIAAAATASVAAPIVAHAPAAVPVAEPSAASIGAPVAHLVVIKPDGTEGAKIPIVAGEVALGRDSVHDVLSGDPFLSPLHATLKSEAGSFAITDNGSLNGVFIRIRGERELEDGDFVRLGQELLHFQLMSSVTPLIAKANETLTGGSPDTGYWGRISLVSGPDLESRAFVLSSDEVHIGREVGDILFRDDGFVSGRHARIAKVEGKVFLKDLGSSNGTYVRIRTEYSLVEGDLILMGQQLFKLVSC